MMMRSSRTETPELASTVRSTGTDLEYIESLVCPPPPGDTSDSITIEKLIVPSPSWKEGSLLKSQQSSKWGHEKLNSLSIVMKNLLKNNFAQSYFLIFLNFIDFFFLFRSIDKKYFDIILTSFLIIFYFPSVYFLLCHLEMRYDRFKPFFNSSWVTIIFLLYGLRYPHFHRNVIFFLVS